MNFEIDIEEGLRRRDAGKSRVRSGAPEWWKIALVHRVAALPQSWVGQPEDWRRLMITEVGVYDGYSKNVWGAMTTMLRRLGLIEPTGRRVPMKSVKSHGRMTDEYRRVK